MYSILTAIIVINGVFAGCKGFVESVVIEQPDTLYSVHLLCNKDGEMYSFDTLLHKHSLKADK